MPDRRKRGGAGLGQGRKQADGLTAEQCFEIAHWCECEHQLIREYRFSKRADLQAEAELLNSRWKELRGAARLEVRAAESHGNAAKAAKIADTFNRKHKRSIDAHNKRVVAARDARPKGEREDIIRRGAKKFSQDYRRKVTPSMIRKIWIANRPALRRRNENF